MESTVDKGALIETGSLRANVKHAYLWKCTFDDEWVAMIEPGELALENLPGDIADILDYLVSYGTRVETRNRSILLVHSATPHVR